jgi:hypothetical protein
VPCETGDVLAKDAQTVIKSGLNPFFPLTTHLFYVIIGTIYHTFKEELP